ncbi:MAG: outer membrane protein [bacterium]|nr:outer membrane protein [bacterium]
MQTSTKMLLCVALMVPATALARDNKGDTVETASGKHASVGDANDRKFIEKAASGGMAEVKLGQLAAEKGTSPAVKEFGKRMVEDHSKANDELKSIASKKNVPLPTDVDSKAKATYEKLAKLSGPDFDKAYLDAMVKDHDEDVKEFKNEASKSNADPELKEWAQKTLSVIEEHDHMAHQDKEALKK